MPDTILIYRIIRMNKVGSVTLKVKVKSLSRAQLFATPRMVAYQAPRSMGFNLKLSGEDRNLTKNSHKD